MLLVGLPSTDAVSGSYEPARGGEEDGFQSPLPCTLTPYAGQFLYIGHHPNCQGCWCYFIFPVEVRRKERFLLGDCSLVPSLLEPPFDRAFT